MAKISGTVTLGISETPGQATVLALDSTCENVVASTESDPVTGAYEFPSIANGDYYLLLLGAGVYRSKIFGPCTAQIVSSYKVNAVSLLHFDGADASTSMFDEVNRSWTAVGNAQLDVSQSKFGGSSLLLDGSGDYLTSPNSDDFNFGAGDFCIEAWVRPTQAGTIFAKRTTSATQSGYTFVITTSGANLVLAFVSWGGSGSTTLHNLIGTIPISTSDFTHVAVARQAGQLRLFVNGVQDGSQTTFAAIASNTELARIGSTPQGDALFAGHIDELRVVKGSAIYTSAFTPATEAFQSGRVVSQLHFDGADNSTLFFDVAGKVWTAGGNAKISAAQSKFGGSALYLDGVGDWIETPDSPDFAQGSRNFTLELWMKSPGNGAYDQICGQRTTSDDYNQNLAVTRNNTNNTLLMGYTNGTSIISAAGTAVVFDDQWHHIALVRNGTSMKQYVDGVLDASLTLTAGFSLIDMATKLSIGRSGEYNGQYYKGYIDEFRLTDGIALYTADFTPPTEPFPDPELVDPYFSNVASLLHFDGADGSTTFTDEIGNAWSIAAGTPQIDTANFAFGGAALLLAAGDNVTTPSGAGDFSFGTGDYTIEGWFKPTKDSTAGYGSEFFLDLGINLSNGLAFSLSSAGRLEVRSTTGNKVGIATTISSARLYYLSISKVGNTLYVGVDGVVSSYSFTAPNHTYDSTVKLGGSSGFGYAGVIDDLRITKGIARYIANYTPPKQPHSNS